MSTISEELEPNHIEGYPGLHSSRQSSHGTFGLPVRRWSASHSASTRLDEKPEEGEILIGSREGGNEIPLGDDHSVPFHRTIEAETAFRKTFYRECERK